MKCAGCDREVTARRRWCAECLPSVSVVGEREWRRRYRALVRAVEVVAVEAPLGGHRAAFARMVAALEPGPEHAAVVTYGEGLAVLLDASPTVAAGREYRLACALLLGEVAHDREDAAELALHAEFVRLVSTPVGVC